MVLAPEAGDEKMGEEGSGVGERGHIGELKRGPFPTVGFALDHGQRGGALEGEGEKHQQGDGAGGTEIVVQGALQGEVARGGIGSIERAERADDHFAREDRGNQADADAPVEPQRLDHRLDEMPHAADEALVQLRRRAAGERQIGEEREHGGDNQDHAAGVFREHPGAIGGADQHGAQRGPAVFGQLQDEGHGR